MPTLTPFGIAIPETDLDDLDDRLARTRWGVPLPGEPWERGMPVDALRELVEYWRTGYDWRAQEALLNDDPSDREKRRLEMLEGFRTDGHGYFEIQATRPQRWPTPSTTPRSGCRPGSARSSTPGPTSRSTGTGS